MNNYITLIVYDLTSAINEFLNSEVGQVFCGLIMVALIFRILLWVLNSGNKYLR